MAAKKVRAGWRHLYFLYFFADFIYFFFGNDTAFCRKKRIFVAKLFHLKIYDYDFE
jgi:hypothetical protein